MPSERSPRRLSSNVRDKDEDQNRRRRLQDSAPLEPSSNSDFKQEAKNANIFDRKGNERGETTDPAPVPRSRSHFQHDGRGSTAHDGRRSGRRMTPERRKWRDSREGDRATRRTAVSGPSEKEKPGARAGDSHVSRHDKVSEVDKNTDPPAKKRRRFREEKLSPEPVGKAVPEPSKDSNALSTNRNVSRQEENYIRHHPLERSDYGRAYGRARSFSNGERVQRTDLPPRVRFNGGENDNRFKGRDTFSGRQGYPSSAGLEEKWKHDLYDEANGSPAKNEDDPVAKVEALLSL